MPAPVSFRFEPTIVSVEPALTVQGLPGLARITSALSFTVRSTAPVIVPLLKTIPCSVTSMSSASAEEWSGIQSVPTIQSRILPGPLIASGFHRPSMVRSPPFPIIRTAGCCSP